MFRTRGTKIFRDILSRKGRTLLVVLSIMIGVFGAATMISVTDLINRQLKEDIKPEAIAHTHVYLVPPAKPISLEENQTYLDDIRVLPDVLDAEGQAVYPVAWQKADTQDPDDFNDGFMVAFSEPFDQANLEPTARTTQGRYPMPNAGEIAVEQRFADANGIKLGDKLQFLGDGSATKTWTVVGFVLHPYFIVVPSLQDQLQQKDAIYATYADAQEIVGFAGFTAIHVRYTSVDASKQGNTLLLDTLADQTSYVPVFTFFDDPDKNFLVNVVGQVNSVLNLLGILSIAVSGFLVTNVISTVINEQKRQIGVMKSIGATVWDNFYIYSGMSLVYGVIGTLLGILIALPVAGWMAQQVAAAALTYIDSFKISPVGLGIGIGMGLLVPVLAALMPILNGTRISILNAMTDLGISSNWGKTRMSRLIGGLPFPTSVVYALSNIYQKKGRLTLTILTLMLAVAAFMGVTAVFQSMDSFVNGIYNVANYHIALTPQSPQDYERINSLLTEQFSDIEAVYAGYSAALGVEGFKSTNPLTKDSNQVTAIGIDPDASAITFDLKEGEGWRDNPNRKGVIVSQTVANSLKKGVGDTLTFAISGKTYHYDIIGVDNFVFDAVYVDYRELATLAGYLDEAGNPMTGIYYIKLRGDPDAKAVDDKIDGISKFLLENGVSGTYINQPEAADIQAQQITVFGLIFNITSAIMAAVGAIGLMATLSMAVFERQREIGVMRSVGAGSSTVIWQFLLEGILVGVIAWIIAAPLSLGLGFGLLSVLPFDYVSFSYPPLILVIGLTGVMVIAAFASIWPSLGASRKTVSDILRYQ